MKPTFQPDPPDAHPSLLRTGLVRLYQKFTEFIREKRSGERSEILKIKEYLQLHYSENIDLNLIAELVNITPSHLSNLFKKETGVNFSHLSHGCPDEGSQEAFTVAGISDL